MKYGGTTFFEAYRPAWNSVLGINDAVPNNQCGYTSLCHPWGGGVTKWLSEEVLGIKPTSPGFKTFDVTPHLGRTLTSVTGTTPTPCGAIRASFNVSSGDCMVTVPAGTVGRVGIPKAEKSIEGILVNGKQAWNGGFLPVPGMGGASQDSDFVFFTDLQPGAYTIAVAYRGSTPSYVEPPEIFPARFVGEDARTGGNWGGVYGKDGYVLCNYQGNGSDRIMLPAYISGVNYYMSWSGKPNRVVWASGTNDLRALAPDGGNATSRTAAGIFTGDPMACQQAFTVTIHVNNQHDYQVALYFVDFDDKGRRQAVDMFDENTLCLISPTRIVKDFRGGKYLVYSYNRAARFRIYHVRGDNAVLSGILFQSHNP
jgi:alpha-L-rhamnosidase